MTRKVLFAAAGLLIALLLLVRRARLGRRSPSRPVRRWCVGGVAGRGHCSSCPTWRPRRRRPSGARSSGTPSAPTWTWWRWKWPARAAPAEALPSAAQIGTGWPLALIRDTLYRATSAGRDPVDRAGRPRATDRRQRTPRPGPAHRPGRPRRRPGPVHPHRPRPDHAPTRTGRPAGQGRQGRPEHADGAGPHRPGLHRCSSATPPWSPS